MFFVFLEQPSYPEAQFIGNVSKVDGLSGTFYFNGNEYRNHSKICGVSAL